MNTKLMMTASAIFLAVAGMTLTFLPEEIMQYTGIGASKALQLILQLTGALYFGFAMLNWMAKGSTIGGIYNRPTAIANFGHFFIGALGLLKAVMKDNSLPYAIWALAIIYSIFAVLFWLVLSRSPINNQKSKSHSVITEHNKEGALQS